jgi:hypothetical protein
MVETKLTELGPEVCPSTLPNPQRGEMKVVEWGNPIEKVCGEGRALGQEEGDTVSLICAVRARGGPHGVLF